MTGRRTLLLVAHGSLREPRAFVPALDHAAEIRETEVFDEVAAAFLKGDPAVGDVLASIDAGHLVVVPLFVSDGYYVGEVVPEAVEAGRRDGVAVEYTPPVGTHGAMTDVILSRARSAVDAPGSAGVALVGHGSEEGSANREAVREHADRVRERSGFREVRSFFLEEEPAVDRLTARFESSEIAAVPVFMAEGHHVREDVPERIGLAGDGGVDGKAVRYTDPVGTDPAVADVVLDRAVSALPTGARGEHDQRSPEGTP